MGVKRRKSEGTRVEERLPERSVEGKQRFDDAVVMSCY
jgi:hypothetical protein